VLGLAANERVGATEPIPEVVDLMGLLSNKRCGGGHAFDVLQTLTKRLLFGREGHGISARSGLFFADIRMEARGNA
jgi:hypothetical protein